MATGTRGSFAFAGIGVAGGQGCRRQRDRHRTGQAQKYRFPHILLARFG
jgi:hypothetical protein